MHRAIGSLVQRLKCSTEEASVDEQEVKPQELKNQIYDVSRIFTKYDDC